MDKHFLMGYNDALDRSVSHVNEMTFINPRLRSNLIKLAMMRAFDFYFSFFSKSYPELNYDELVTKYDHDFSYGMSLGLFKTGGIEEKDHLNFWCLARSFEPEIYIESGVFIGSSLHAFIGSPNLEKVIAIDPDLSKLLIPKLLVPGAMFIDDKDFSQLEIDNHDARIFAYFDDHINTADRILQASQKGLTYLLFDDSTGLEGICQRLYPSIPTVPMIMNCDLLNPGDQFSWTFMGSNPNEANQKNSGVRVTYQITETVIDKCMQAKKCIKKYSKIPDLGEFIPQMYPGKMIDTSKYLVQLY